MWVQLGDLEALPVAITSFEHAGLHIAIEPDPRPLSPRQQFDLLGRMVFWHPAAILGDEPPLPIGTLAAELARTRDARVWLPLWVLEIDGGLELRVGQSTDEDAASADGLIYATAREVRRRMGLLRVSRRAVAEAGAILRREVEDYVQFIRREMLQVVIGDQDGELVDRCGGFYTQGYASNEAMRLAEYHAAQLRRYAPTRLNGPHCP